MKNLVLLIAVLVLVPGVVAKAQQQPQPPSAQEEFVPVSSLPQAEQLPAAPLLIGAYAFVWVALMVYVWSLWRRMTRLERELADLQRRLPKQ
ncbi:MAG: CcmD family protein [Vicinamibacterales bacterium]